MSVLSRVVCPFCDQTVDLENYCLAVHSVNSPKGVVLCLGSNADAGLLFSNLSI